MKRFQIKFKDKIVLEGVAFSDGFLVAHWLHRDSFHVERRTIKQFFTDSKVSDDKDGECEIIDE